MRKMISLLSFLGIVMLLLPLACKRTVTYSELSRTLVDSLRPTSYPGVMIAGVRNIQQQNPANTGALRCPKKCVTKTISWVQCTYPITVCYPPDIIIDGVYTQGRRAQDSIPGIINAEGTLREMVSTQNVNLLWCKTKYGPWMAEITEQENCDNACGEGSHSFTLEILGSQGQLFWRWDGTLDGRPQQVQFVGQPFVRNSFPVDCDLSDLTDCTGTGGGGGGGNGGHPARVKLKQ